MRIIKFVFFLGLTGTLIYFLDNPISVSGTSIPPLGKFLSPAHGFWQNIEADSIPTTEQISLTGLKAPVSVTYDAYMIPHIQAESEEDAYFMQGYVTAKHRLWQMEFQVLFAGGRISEVIGARALPVDRRNRRNGLGFGAENGLRILEDDPLAMGILNAYTAGINAYISSLEPADYPFEYKLLDYGPEPWTPMKSILLLKYMANNLSSYEQDLEQTNLLTWLGREQYDMLFPIKAQDVDPIIPEGTVFDFEPVPIDTPEVDFPLQLTPQTLEKPNPDNGSNNFTIHGSKTMNGYPILANEPDLGLNLPSLWYVLQLQAPGLNVMGGSLPGSPGVIIGFNDSIAWGVTNARRDVKDWYRIEFRNDAREEYRYGDQWLKVQRRIETIKIRDGKDYVDTVLYTHHGPVTYDDNFPTKRKGQYYAQRWTGHDPSKEVMSFYQLNHGKNLSDFKEALSKYVGPAQNFVFASAKGNIALQIGGQFPLKWKDQGRFLMDGSNPEHDWQGMIPFEHSAFAMNPPQGFLSSANQFPVPESYPYYVYDPVYEHYRNRRINMVLDSLDRITELDAKRLQNDNYNLIAADMLPYMLDSLDRSNITEAQRKALTHLESWDYYNEPESVAAVFFEAWMDKFGLTVWDEFEAREEPLVWPQRYRAIELMKEDPDNRFFDVIHTADTESVVDVINMTFELAVDSVANWQAKTGEEVIWMNYKNSNVQHLLKLAPFGRDHIRIGGNHNIVNAAQNQHGPSWRMVVELGPEVKAWGIYPGGQSGNVGSKWHANLIDKWAAGEYLSLPFVKPGQQLNSPVLVQDDYQPQLNQ